MNKTIIALVLFIFTSCIREDFNQTQLVISHQYEEPVSTTKIWLNIYNPNINFYHSTVLSPNQKNLNITLPNADGYVIYGLSYKEKMDEKHAFIAQKYFKRVISLQEGGTQYVSLDLAKENVRYFADEQFLDFEGNPLKLIINPCTQNTYNNCRTGNQFGESGVGSVRIKFFKYEPSPENKNFFRDDQILWVSRCIPRASYYFDPLIKFPFRATEKLPWNMRLEVFYDFECKHADIAENPDAQNSFYGIPHIQESPSGPWLTPIDNSGWIATLTFLIDKLESGERCHEGFNCESGYCLSGFCQSDYFE